MSDPRFFVDLPLACGADIELPPDAGHHALRVLRLRGGDRLVLFNGRGGEFGARMLEARAGGPAGVRVLSFDAVEREAALRLTLIQGLVAHDKLDWVVEKAVELGVARLIVVPLERSVVRLDAARTTRRLQRWREIAAGACAQCGRNRVPTVDAAADFAAALAAGAGAAHRLILEPSASRRGLPATPGDYACAIGPEGGFTSGELAAARACGYEAVALGARVLRTETAGLALAAALMARAGEFG